ncbi:MAG: MFS transporter [Chloroflexi bacterium]|nr:MAG: MFS transporter [Chloroflexota bacterium]
MQSSRKMWVTAGYYAAFIALGLVQASLGPTLPGLAAHTGVDLADISALFLARSAGYLTGALFGGRLFDRLPGHPMMAAVLVVMAVTMALTPLVPLLWALMAVLLVLGMAESVLDVGGNTLLVWVHGRAVGPFMNGLHFFFGVGAFLSPIIVAQAILLTGGITWAYWTLALLVLPMALWLARLPDPPNAAATTGEAVVAGQPARPVRAGQRNLVALLAVFLFLYVGAEVGYGGWVYSYALRRGLADAATAAYLTSAFWGVFTVGRLVGIPAALRFRTGPVLLVDLLGALVGVAAVWLWPDSRPVLWLGTMATGFFLASIFPNTLALAGEYLHVTGEMTGWFFAGASLGAMAVPWLVGQLFEALGPQALPLILLVDLLAAVAVLAAVMLAARRMGVRPVEASGQVVPVE